MSRDRRSGVCAHHCHRRSADQPFVTNRYSWRSRVRSSGTSPQQTLDFDPDGRVFLGELSLNGELQPIKGALPLAQEAKRLGYKEIFLPEQNASEAALVDGIIVYGAKTLKEVIDHIYKIKLDKKGQTIEKDIPKISATYLRAFLLLH